MSQKKRNILVGVCGGIAIYKICRLIRCFRKDNYSVKVIMTDAATQFIRPLIFKELSNSPVYLDMFSLKSQGTQHIKLSEWADLAVISPLSANTLSKVACGICDNLLTTAICAFDLKKPVLFVPAMNKNMWGSPIIRENLNRLKKIKNYTIVLPKKGRLACGTKGIGRMAEPEEIHRKSKALLK